MKILSRTAMALMFVAACFFAIGCASDGSRGPAGSGASGSSSNAAAPSGSGAQPSGSATQSSGSATQSSGSGVR